MDPKENKTPLSSFFIFKNKETEVEILKILNSHEGIFEEEAERYLNFSHSRVKAGLFVDVKNIVRKFWVDHKELPFSDVVGLFNMVLMDMQHDIINKGNNFVEKMKKSGRM